MGKYLAGIDAGTTGARCAIFDVKGNHIASAYREYGAVYPKAGWVEQDSRKIIDVTFETCREAVKSSGIKASEISSIGFSAQRSVTIAVDGKGKVIRPMISWQDARTAAQVEFMKKHISPEEFYENSGVPMGTTWMITKILWMKENEPELFGRTSKFIQHHDLILNAFGASEFYTDISDMAFYGVWDVRKVDWNPKLMKMFGMDPSMFGKPIRSGIKVAEISESVSEKTGFAVGTPVCSGAGDQNCSVLGMGAIRPRIATVTLGTAGLAILSTDRPLPGFGGMMITNHIMPGMWEAEGLSNAAACSFRWYRDNFACLEVEAEKNGGANAYEKLAELAATAPAGSRGLLFMPYLATACTPHWNPDARAALIGMSLAHGRPEITRSILEGITFEIRDMLEAWFSKGLEVDFLRLGGGATKSRLWCQIQADIYGRPVQLLKVGESTALGAAILGGTGAGIFKDIGEGVNNMVHVSCEVEPDMKNNAVYSEMYQAYSATYRSLAEKTFPRLAALQR